MWEAKLYTEHGESANSHNSKPTIFFLDEVKTPQGFTGIGHWASFWSWRWVFFSTPPAILVRTLVSNLDATRWSHHLKLLECQSIPPKKKAWSRWTSRCWKVFFSRKVSEKGMCRLFPPWRPVRVLIFADLWLCWCFAPIFWALNFSENCKVMFPSKRVWNTQIVTDEEIFGGLDLSSTCHF